MVARHTMTVPLQLLVRDTPPANPATGDMYFDSSPELLSVQVWDGTKWGGLKTSGADEVSIQTEQPLDQYAELWVDVDEPGPAQEGGAYLPIEGGTLLGTLGVNPDAGTTGIHVHAGGVRLDGPQIPDRTYAVTKGYVDDLIETGGGGGGGIESSYVHYQATPSKLWAVIHNLGRHPVVSVEDGGGSVVYGGVQYFDDNTLYISFTNIVTGRANCT